MNQTQPLTLQEVSLLSYTRAGSGEAGNLFFTTRRWHLVHCMYYWKKLFLAQKLGTTIERRYDILAHIEHCQKTVLKEGSLDVITTGAEVALHSDWINGRRNAEGHQHDNQ